MEKLVEILGVRIDNVTMAEAVEKLRHMAKEDGIHTVFTPNSEILYVAKNDPEFREILNRSDLNTADGIGVVYAGKILKQPIKERVAGFDLASAFLPVMEQEGLRLFLFGSVEGVAAKAKDKLLERFPKLQIVGLRNGFFEDDEAVLEEINRTEPDVVFVCLGAPKQEKFIMKYKNQFHAKILMGLGGSINVFAGEVKRAPDFFIKAHLEWFYRIATNPTRIGRMMTLPKFAWAVIKSKGNGGKNND